jgi:hypothetical protein
LISVKVNFHKTKHAFGGEKDMLNEKLLEIIDHEGVTSIVSWNENAAHISNTWNSYVRVTGDDRLLIPAAGMQETQKNIGLNPSVKLTLASREVQGTRYLGAGYLIEGTAAFLESGPEYDMMKEKFPFLSRVLAVTIESARQTL